MTDLRLENPQQTREQIVAFLKDTYTKARKTQAVIAVSGGIDSAVSLTLLVEALGGGSGFSSTFTLPRSGYGRRQRNRPLE